MKRRDLLFGLGGTCLAAMPGRAANAPLRIGVLADMSGPLSNISGDGSVTSARMAVEDFGGSVLGRPIEILVGDMQTKVDIGVEVARHWYDVQGVDVICDIPNSAVALAVQTLATQRKRIVLQSAAGTTELTGRQCSFYGVHWTFDTYALAKGVVSSIIDQGGDTWFMIVTDYAFGLSLEANARQIIESRGGRVLGSARYPSETTDFASYLMQARASGAKVIGLATNTNGAENLIKQAREFGIVQSGQRVAALILYLADVHAVGLEAAQGTLVEEAYYWDLDDAMRAFGKRLMAHTGAVPNQTQAAAYSAVTHYLKAMAACGTTDADAVMRQMRATPINDFMTHDGRIREDGRVVRDMYLFQVKSPAESRGPWDYYKLLRRIPGEETVIPLAETGCPLLVQTKQ